MSADRDRRWAASTEPGSAVGPDTIRQSSLRPHSVRFGTPAPRWRRLPAAEGAQTLPNSSEGGA